MVCVGACAPTHTIFALLCYLDLSRYPYYKIFSLSGHMPPFQIMQRIFDHLNEMIGIEWFR